MKHIRYFLFPWLVDVLNSRDAVVFMITNGFFFFLSLHMMVSFTCPSVVAFSCLWSIFRGVFEVFQFLFLIFLFVLQSCLLLFLSLPAACDCNIRFSLCTKGHRKIFISFSIRFILCSHPLISFFFGIPDYSILHFFVCKRQLESNKKENSFHGDFIPVFEESIIKIK